MTPNDIPIEPPAGHVVDELPLLLGGELGRSQLSVVVRHLRDCPGCRAELVEATGAHSALTATRRILDPSRAPIALDEPAGSDGPLDGSDAAEPLPPLSIRSKRSGRSRSGRSRSGRVRSGSDRRRDLVVALSAAAAAVVIAAGGIAAYQNWPGRSPAATSRAASQQAALTPVVASSGAAPVPNARGVVSMSGTHDVVMTIRVTGLPPAAAGHFYYAWLLDASTNKMLPVGVVSSDGVATFDLGVDLVRHYTAVDISLQADNGDPAHSAESVLRASYASA